MNLSSKISIIFLLLGFSGQFCLAQQKVKIVNSDQTEGTRKGGEQITKFKGNVIFERGDTRIYCDEATYYQTREFIEASGHVHIVDGDSVDITSQKLSYDANTRVAELRKNVVFRKKGVMTLYTNNLNYYREQQLAYYFNNGKLVDSTNTLTSRKGYYQVSRNLASFKGKVVGKNDNFTLTTDTLQYSSTTKIVYFFDKTFIKDKDGNNIEYHEGSYETETRVSELANNTIHSESYVITSDYLNVLDRQEIYKANVNVKLVDDKNDIIITGQSATYWKKDLLTKVYDNPVLKIVMDKDTLYLTADTLVAVDSKIEANKKLYAYRNVRIYKKDLMGRADSLVYHVSDSMINFYFKPVLWVEENQISADSITAFMANRKIDRMELVSNSFVISQDTMQNFNQIKGRKIMAYFKDNDLSKVDVTGNGESIFYALNDDQNQVIGMNKSQSSSITLLFENNKAKSVKFYTNVDSSLIPPHELKAGDKTLKGFSWRVADRPTKEQVLHLKMPENPLDEGRAKQN